MLQRRVSGGHRFRYVRTLTVDDFTFTSRMMYDLVVYHFFSSFLFPGVFFHSGVIGACAVTTDFIAVTRIYCEHNDDNHNEYAW